MYGWDTFTTSWLSTWLYILCRKLLNDTQHTFTFIRFIAKKNFILLYFIIHSCHTIFFLFYEWCNCIFIISTIVDQISLLIYFISLYFLYFYLFISLPFFFNFFICLAELRWIIYLWLYCWYCVGVWCHTCDIFIYSMGFNFFLLEK